MSRFDWDSDRIASGEAMARVSAVLGDIVAPRVGYWSVIDEEDPDNVFRATPVARAIRTRADALAAKP